MLSSEGSQKGVEAGKKEGQKKEKKKGEKEESSVMHAKEPEQEGSVVFRDFFTPFFAGRFVS